MTDETEKKVNNEIRTGSRRPENPHLVLKVLAFVAELFSILFQIIAILLLSLYVKGFYDFGHQLLDFDFYFYVFGVLLLISPILFAVSDYLIIRSIFHFRIDNRILFTLSLLISISALFGSLYLFAGILSGL